MRFQPHDLRGMYARDRDGAPVGTVEELYVDRPTGEIRYLGLAADAIGVHVLVPLDEVVLDEDDLGPAVRLPYTRAQLMAAPALPPGAEATVALEGEIHSHFARTPYWDVVRARQTTPTPTPEIAAAEGADAARQAEPAPTTRIADAEVEAALARGDDPDAVRVKRWGT